MSTVYLSTCKISTTYFNIEDFIDRILSKVKKKKKNNAHTANSLTDT